MHDGRHIEKYRKDKGDVLVLVRQFGEEIVYVRRNDVKRYVENQEFQYYLSVYQYTVLWGLPNNAGWANEPIDVINALTALELEERLIQNEKIDGKKMNTRG